jgi:hypothetical protein
MVFAPMFFDTKNDTKWKENDEKIVIPYLLAELTFRQNRPLPLFHWTLRQK